MLIICLLLFFNPQIIGNKYMAQWQDSNEFSFFQILIRAEARRLKAMQNGLGNIYH